MRLFLTALILILTFSNSLFADYEFNFQGNSYKIVESKSTWTDAAKSANDAGGHLVYINSEKEQNYIYNVIMDSAKIRTNYTIVNDGGGVAYIWIGATDLGNEGNWRWDGNNSGKGVMFWQGQGAAGANDGKAIDGNYQNWGGQIQYNLSQEPDNYLNNQNSAAIALEAWPKNLGMLGKASEWNDINSNNSIYYIVEFEGSTKVNNDKSRNLQLNIFPNPASDFLSISDNSNDFNLAEISLINLNGKTFKFQSNISKSIDISNLPIGTYFLFMNNQTEFYYQKIIIKR